MKPSENTKRTIRFGKYRVGREWMQKINERAHRLELAEKGIRPGPTQIKLNFPKD